MDINVVLIIVAKLIVSFLLGAFIGFDRERHGRDAGTRTNHLVRDVAAVSRVIANIVTGVGFLGAGIIYRNSSAGTSHGLTTAATVWCTAAVGVAVGLNMFIIATVGAVALYFLLSLHHQHWYVKWKQKMLHKHGESN